MNYITSLENIIVLKDFFIRNYFCHTDEGYLKNVYIKFREMDIYNTLSKESNLKSRGEFTKANKAVVKWYRDDIDLDSLNTSTAASVLIDIASNGNAKEIRKLPISRTVLIADSISLLIIQHIAQHITTFIHKDIREIILFINKSIIINIDMFFRKKVTQDFLNDLRIIIQILIKKNIQFFIDGKLPLYLLSFLPNYSKFLDLKTHLDFLAMYWSNIDKKWNLNDRTKEIITKLSYKNIEFNFELLNKTYFTQDEIKYLSILDTQIIYDGLEEDNKFSELNNIECILDTNEHIHLLTKAHKLKNIKCYDFKNNFSYSYQYIDIKLFLNSIESLSDSITTYTVGTNFIRTLDPVLFQKIDDIIIDRTTQNYIYIICSDDYISNKIITYLTWILGTDHLEPVEFFSTKQKYYSNYLLIENFSDLDYAIRKDVWHRLKLKGFNNSSPIFEKGFALFLDDKLPNSNKEIIEIGTSHIWKYDHILSKSNFSAIVFSVIAYHLKQNQHKDLTISQAIQLAIKQNKYLFVFNNVEINFSILEGVIKKITKTDIVDISSPTFWLKVRENYIDELEFYNGTLLRSHDEIIVKFKFIREKDKEFWVIKGLQIDSPFPNSKEIVTCLLSIYCQKIHVSHAKTLANHFCRDKKSKNELRKRISAKKNNTHNDNSTVGELIKKAKNLDKIRSIQKKGGISSPNKSDRKKLADFFSQHIKLEKNYVVFSAINPKTNLINKTTIYHNDFNMINGLFTETTYRQALIELLQKNY